VGSLAAVIRPGFFLLSFNMLAMGLGVARQLLIANRLSPESYGIWNLLTVACTYANYADVGLNTGLLYTPGAASRDKLNSLAWSSLLWAGVLGLVVGFCILGAVLITHRFSLMHGLVIAIACIVFPIGNVLVVIARLQERFVLIGVSALGTAALSLLFVLVISIDVSW